MTETETEYIYPPERTATIPCARCRGKGAVSAIAGHCFDIDGGLWHEPGECKAPEHRERQCCPPCRSCAGKGVIPRKHYAYCKRAACIGCLPTIDELDRMPNILDVWAEMLARCIPQSPATKTHEGAMVALRANESEYHTAAFFARRYNLLIESLRPMLAGCQHDFDPECARCELLTPVRLAIEEADKR